MEYVRIVSSVSHGASRWLRNFTPLEENRINIAPLTFGIFAWKLRAAISANCILFMTVAADSYLAQLAMQLARENVFTLLA